MAVGDYVFDNEQPPPELTRALNYQKWGVNARELPAGILPVANVCINYYNAIYGYKSAPKKSEWTKRNPFGWNLASWYISERRKRG